MRILHVLPELNRSGAEIMLLTGAAELRRPGYDHSILLVKKDGGGLAESIRAAGYPVAFHELWKTPAAALRYAGILRRVDPDIVHVHVEYNHALLCAVPLLQGRGVCRTMHSISRFSGLQKVRKAAERWLLSRGGVRYIACSHAVQQNEIDHLGLSPGVIDNWFDAARFTPPSDEQRAAARRGLGLGPDDFVIAMVGNCAPLKNHPAMIEALAILNRDGAAILLHAGREDADHTERTLAKKFGVADKAIFAGPVADVRHILHAADVFVLPSFSEGSSIALMEAAATGLPSIVTNVGLAPEIAGQAGVAVTEPDAASIASAVRSWMAEPVPARRSKGLALSDYVRARFSPARGAAEYCELYATLGKRAR